MKIFTKSTFLRIKTADQAINSCELSDTKQPLQIPTFQRGCQEQQKDLSASKNLSRKRQVFLKDFQEDTWWIVNFRHRFKAFALLLSKCLGTKISRALRSREAMA